MCGRFTARFTWAEIHEQLSQFVEQLAKEVPDEIAHAPARYNVAPTQPILVFKRQGTAIKAQLMRWGLVPEWVKDPRDFPLIVNARSETLLDKPSFRNAIKNRRCIIPASGYYEWLRADNQKVPHYITRKDGRPMLFAGLHSTWMGPDGEEVDTATIITVPANAELAAVHDRSPAILEGEEVSDWLDEAHVNGQKAHAMLRPVSPGTTLAVVVSSRVNSARNEGEDLIVPVVESAQGTASSETDLADEVQTEPVEDEAPPKQMSLF